MKIFNFFTKNKAKKQEGSFADFFLHASDKEKRRKECLPMRQGEQMKTKDCSSSISMNFNIKPPKTKNRPLGWFLVWSQGVLNPSIRVSNTESSP